MTLTNYAISTARSLWYRASEPVKLRMARKANEECALCDGGPNQYHPSRYPLVSVVIPTYNRSALLLERSLKSVLSQTYWNMEVIVAAHGCTDETEQLVRAIPDRRVRLLSVPRTRTYPPTAENHWFVGPVVPINAGLAAARGAYIARNDDDDVWTADHIESLLRFCADGNHEFVSAAHATDRGIVAPYVENGVAIGGVQTWLYRSYLKTFRANPHAWRKRWARVNDTDLQDRFMKAGVRMGYLDKVVAHVLPRPGETEVGLKAYRSNPEITAKYAFR